MDTFTIRLLNEQDVGFYNEVRNECRQFLHDDSEFSYEQALNWFKSKGSKDPFFIYEINNERIGYFRTSNWQDRSCYVGMDIHKDYRGKKLAVAAYRKFIEFLNKEYQIEKFKLEALKDNERALSLYKKLGFKQVSEYKIENSTRTSIIMEKRYSC